MRHDETDWDDVSSGEGQVEGRYCLTRREEAESGWSRYAPSRKVGATTTIVDLGQPPVRTCFDRGQPSIDEFASKPFIQPS